MSLNSISVEFVAENAERIICNATVASPDGNKATMLGQGKDIDSASQAAITNSKAQLAMLSGTKEPQSTYYPSQSNNNNQPINNTMEDKSKFNGGGRKPASDKQISWIESSARKRRISGDALAQEKFGKYMHELPKPLIFFSGLILKLFPLSTNRLFAIPWKYPNSTIFYKLCLYIYSISI